MRDEQLEPVLHHEAILNVFAQTLPRRIVQPCLFALLNRFGTGHQQAHARDVLRNRQLIHAQKQARLGDDRAVTIGAHRRVVHIAAPRDMAQRHHDCEYIRFIRIRPAFHQIARLYELEISLGGFLHLRTGDHVAAVVELARVAETVPILHFDFRARSVKHLMLRIPIRAIVKIGDRLHVVGRLLITARRLVTKTPRNVVVGLTQRFDLNGS